MSRIRPYQIVTVLCLMYVIFVLAANNNDPLALVTLGTRFSQGNSAGSEGYDGQFNYYIARDPDSAAAFIDVPAYRFQRILLPAAGRALALGQEAWIPWAFVFINLIALAVSTALMERLLVDLGASRWYALTIGLTIGMFGSVRLSLAEPLAYGLVIGAIWVIRRGGWMQGAVLLALSALAKETTLFFVAGYGLYWLLQRQWRKVLIFGLVAGLPFVIWQLILRQQFGSFGIGSGGALATSFEIIPFGGVIRIISDLTPEQRGAIPALLAIFGIILVPFVLLPTLWALRECWQKFRRGVFGSSLYPALLLVNAIIMPFVPFSTYREPLGILRFIIGLQIALILYAAATRQRRPLLFSLVWIVTIFFAFNLVSIGTA